MTHDFEASKQAIQEKRLTAPTIHLNGTSGEDLFRQYCDASAAIREAIEHLPVPHMRDYYVAPGSWEAARAQYDRQIKALRQILHELYLILENLSGQREAREE